MIQDFIGRVKRDGFAMSKPFLYEVMMTWPTTVSLMDNQLMSLYCHRASLPGINFMTQPTKIYGYSYEMPYEMVNETVSLTFYVDRYHVIMQNMWKMREAMFNLVDGSPKERSSYMFQSQIKIFDTTNTNTNVAAYSLENCIIKSISSIDLSYQSMDQVQEVTLTFSFERMTRTPQFAFPANNPASSAMGAMNSTITNPVNAGILSRLGIGVNNSIGPNISGLVNQATKSLGKLF